MRRWGLAITILGTITLFTGTVQALKQEQSKRLLAFHSIGQVGYILLGFGICMALLSVSGPAAALATIGFMAALLHVLNHGIFKGLLFLNAGSMLWATDTQDLNKMGGLMKYMPLTAITALIASFSISGVPLFNGFVSKWSIYVAAIRGTEYVPDLSAYALIAILTSAITLASFVKFFGVSFLSRSSSEVLERAAHQRMEVGWSMQVPQVFLSTLCILIGVLPALAFRLLKAAIAHSQQGFGTMLASTTQADSRLFLGINLAGGAAVFAPVALFVPIALMFGIAIWVAHLGGARRRAAEPWLCGYAQQQDCYRYTAHHFYGELKRYLWWLSGTPRRRQPNLPIVGRK
jgi:formate hydrogenlyase subunit 3/multisubunit Na+/H+ antiporter MnhD subunit